MVVSFDGIFGKGSDLAEGLYSQMVEEAAWLPLVLEQSERYMNVDAENIGDFRRERLYSFLRHAVGNVPAYRKLRVDLPMAADPYEILRAFPLLEKQTLRQEMADYCSDDIDPESCRAAVTSGTTGTPLKLIFDVAYMIDRAAYSLSVANRSTDRKKRSRGRKVLRPCEAWLEGWFECPNPGLDEAVVAYFGSAVGDEENGRMLAARAAEFEPDIIFSTPTRMHEFIEMLSAAGVESKNFRDLHCIETYAETLVPAARAKFSAFFGVPVLDSYGMREFGTIANECSRGRYHLQFERLHVEIVDDAGVTLPVGECGEIVVTGFTNYAMPLIRYRSGDYGQIDAAGVCDCGRPQDTISKIEGRHVAMLRLPGERQMPVNRLHRVLRQFPVERFQVRQIAPSSIHVLFSPAPSFDQHQRGLLCSQLLEAFGKHSDDVTLIVAEGEEYVTAPSGKHLDFISLLPELNADI
ncbi:phenylacetate--CoA ligase family protein [Nocardia gipuzkoensis]